MILTGRNEERVQAWINGSILSVYARLEADATDDPEQACKLIGFAKRAEEIKQVLEAEEAAEQAAR